MKPQNPAAAGAILAILALCAILLSILFLNRPLSTLAFQSFHETRGPFVAITHALDWVELAAVVTLCWAAAIFAFNCTLGPRGLIALRATLALFLAIGVKELAKLAFCRTWPETWVCGNPSFIRDGAFGFSPFHGGAGWGAFPAGHETAIATLAACLWALAPRLRPLCAIAVLAMGVGLLGADYHFLSDVLAGGLLGWMIGLFAARLELPKSSMQ
jgi:membrane-associated phospholipid phosphatase